MEYLGLTLVLLVSICIVQLHGGALDSLFTPKDKKAQCEYCAKDGDNPAFGINGKEYKNECYRKCVEGNLPSIKMKTTTYSDSEETFSSEEFSSEERPQRRRKKYKQPKRKHLDKKGDGDDEKSQKQPKKSIQFHTETKPTAEGKPIENKTMLNNKTNLENDSKGKKEAGEKGKNNEGGLPAPSLKPAPEKARNTTAPTNDATGSNTNPATSGPLSAAPNILQDVFGQSGLLSAWNPFADLASLG